jgi:hypothetical protein
LRPLHLPDLLQVLLGLPLLLGLLLLGLLLLGLLLLKLLRLGLLLRLTLLRLLSVFALQLLRLRGCEQSRADRKTCAQQQRTRCFGHDPPPPVRNGIRPMPSAGMNRKG